MKLTNYRKSGELFENPLTMRPVHDSNGVYRFCIGVQFEITKGQNLKSRLAKLDKLIRLLPSTIEVSSMQTGDRHEVEEAQVETQTDLTQKLEKAITGPAGTTVGPQITGVIQEKGYYADHHISMLSLHWGRSAVGALQAARGDFGRRVGRGHGDTATRRGGDALPSRAVRGGTQAHHKPRGRPHCQPRPEDAAQPRACRPRASSLCRSGPSRDDLPAAGQRPNVHLFEERLNPSIQAQADAAATAHYLSARVQGMTQQCPGREPDMSAEGAAALRAVLQEVGNGTPAGPERDPKWAMLHKLLDTSDPYGTVQLTEAAGVAAGHHHKHREEAARKLIMNHANVLTMSATRQPIRTSRARSSLRWS